MRILILSFHWPPRKGVTAQRGFSLARGLLKRGWDVQVATGPRPKEDESFAGQFPESRVTEIPGFSPHDWYRRLTGRPRGWNAQDCLEVPPPERHRLDGGARWIRANLFVPDARMAWIPGAFRTLRATLTAHPVDVLFSSGPPHSNTWLGSRLSQSTGIPWVADFQDPWTDLDYLKHLPLTPWARRRHASLERQALATASVLTCASPQWAEGLARKAEKPVAFVPWGFNAGECPTPAPQPGRFCVGGTLGPDRHHPWFWEALAAWARTPEGDALQVRCGGNIANSVQREMTARLGNRARWLGNLPRERWLGELSQSWGSVILANRDQPGRIPAKFYESFAMGGPVLIVGARDSAVARLGKPMGAICLENREQVREAMARVAGWSAIARRDQRRRAAVFESQSVVSAFERQLHVSSTPRAQISGHITQHSLEPDPEAPRRIGFFSGDDFPRF